MEIYKEILIKILENQEMQVTFPNLKINEKELIELSCYKTLKNIKNIISDESLNDSKCFMKIEKIKCEFENLNIDIGIRHDFG